MQKVNTGTYFIHLLFFLYLAILLGERVQSLVRSLNDPAVKLWGNGFNGYVYTLTILSLVVSVGYLLFTNRYLFPGIFSWDASVHAKIDVGALCIASGIMLLSGMVHTEYTIAPIQFVAYGALILAMVIKTASVQGSSAHPFLLWFSLIYLTAFSMAIPVMYRSQIRLSPLFHTLEAISAAVLVLAFTWMMYLVFTKDATNLFFTAPILIAAVLDGVLLALRWQEHVNTFVLIFIIVACVCWSVGKVISLRLKA